MRSGFRFARRWAPRAALCLVAGWPALVGPAQGQGQQDGGVRTGSAATISGVSGVSGAGGAGAAGGEAGDFARRIATLPPPQRPEAVLTAVAGLGAEDCAGRMAFLRVLPWDGTEAGGEVGAPFRDLTRCQGYGPARDFYLQALARESAPDLPRLVWAWAVQIGGRYRRAPDLGAAVAAALEDRLRREAGEAGVWSALDAAYVIAGLDARRAAHLRAWLEAKVDPPPADSVLWLARFQAAHAGPAAGGAPEAAGALGAEAALAGLRLAWQRERSYRLGIAMGDLLLELGRPAEIGMLADEMAGDADPTLAAAAHLVRARMVAAEAPKGPAVAERALAEYRAYFEQPAEPEREPAAEYVTLVAALRGPAPAAEAAAKVCARAGVRLAATPGDCATRLLAPQAPATGALAILTALATRSPNDLQSLLRLADQAAANGLAAPAERAYRRILALDPESPGAFIGLSHLAEGRGSLADLESILAASELARGGQPPEVVLAMARALRRAGQPRRAVELLQDLRDRTPGTGIADAELRQAQQALAGGTQEKPR